MSAEHVMRITLPHDLPPTGDPTSSDPRSDVIVRDDDTVEFWRDVSETSTGWIGWAY